MAWQAGLIAGGMGIGGNLIAENTNRRLMNKQMDYNSYMSNTAHQREVKDLRKAGLNPILSATGGAGASSPTVDTPTSVMGNMGDIANSAIQTAAQVDNIDQDTALKKSQEQNNNSATRLNEQEERILKLKEGFFNDASSMYEKGKDMIVKPIKEIYNDIKLHPEVNNPRR